MEITQNLLMSLGFVKDSSTRYHYKAFAGTHDEQAGVFFFDGFRFGVAFEHDMRFLLNLIDYEQ
ncbi:hypothetical protein G8759_20165 [Spirosoma aureum]|uniref:Uncharacterized protein n=1 Tax=Spirosoma aureum TaxID=2692134 RepID=A0A6G9AQW6_9BACT|nr:hypothetical protein [Spirosoma aureum]QIP14768.1 hypothetical protein G8759_20165 [Spirosoma aureum]